MAARNLFCAGLVACGLFAINPLKAFAADQVPDIKTMKPKSNLAGMAVTLVTPQHEAGEVVLGPTTLPTPEVLPIVQDPSSYSATNIKPPQPKATLTLPVQQMQAEAMVVAQAPVAGKSAPGEEVVAWHKHAVNVPVVAGKPRIVIVLDDLGMRKQQTLDAIALNAPLTLAFLPYAPNVSSQAKKARAKGHELIVHVPMQPIGPQNPGPNALLTDLSQDEVQQRLDWALSQFDGYVGANNHMGSKFTQHTEGLETVMKTMADRGLLFLDSVTGPSRAAKSARTANVPFMERDIFLDHYINENSIRYYLKELERVALKKGYAIGIGHPHNVTLKLLKEWLPNVQARGFQIVPISTVMKEKLGQPTLQASVDPAGTLQKVAHNETERLGF